MWNANEWFFFVVVEYYLNQFSWKFKHFPVIYQILNTLLIHIVIKQLEIFQASGKDAEILREHYCHHGNRARCKFWNCFFYTSQDASFLCQLTVSAISIAVGSVSSERENPDTTWNGEPSLDCNNLNQRGEAYRNQGVDGGGSGSRRLDFQHGWHKRLITYGGNGVITSRHTSWTLFKKINK